MEINCLYCKDQIALVNLTWDIAKDSLDCGELCKSCVEAYNDYIDIDEEPCNGSHLRCAECESTR